MYTRTATHWLVRDENNNSHKATFKLDKKEYFTGLASLLEVLTEMLENCQKMQKPPTTHHIELLHALREELDFLQTNCQIVDIKHKE